MRFLLLIFVACAPAPLLLASKQLAFTHVTVIDPETGTAKNDQLVVVQGDRIVSVGATTRVAGQIIDARGKFLIPGLWDMHAHLAVPNMAPLFIANGVTGVRIMWGNPKFGPGTERMHSKLRDAFDKGDKVGPRLLIASDIFDGPKPTWPNSTVLTTPEEARKAVAAAKADGADFIKVYSGLSREVYFAIADESKKQGMPFAGHLPDSIRATEASDAGQKSIEHLTGLLRACSSHEDALRDARVEDERKDHSPGEWWALYAAHTREALATYDAARAATLFATFVRNNTWQCPTLSVLANMATLDDPAHGDDPRMKYIAPFMKQMWDPTHDFRTKDRTPEAYAALRAAYAKQAQLVGAMNKAGVPLLAGTDEVNPYVFAGFSLHDELGLLVGAGLTPAEALRAATWNPARFLEQQEKMGTIAPGKVADLVLLDANPLLDIANTKKISAVVSRGRYYDRAALDALLGEVQAAAAP